MPLRQIAWGKRLPATPGSSQSNIFCNNYYIFSAAENVNGKNFAIQAHICDIRNLKDIHVYKI